MSSIDVYSGQSPFAASPAASFFTRLAAVLQARSAARRRRNAAATLRGLDARILADIGLNRSEIGSMVYGPAERRRRYEDA